MNQQPDHDLLIQIKTTVDIILQRLEGFVTKDELQPLIEREKRCRAEFERFVTQDQFKPVRTLVYGGVGFVLLAVLGSVVALVIAH